MKPQVSSLLALLVSFASTGCLAVEKKTLVLVVPAESKEIHAYEVFQGISVIDSKQSRLEQAKSEINTLKEPDFDFFKINIEKESSLRTICRFEQARFFLHPDPARKRPLCMDRRFTITDRDQFFKYLNQAISAPFKADQVPSDQELLDEFKKLVAKPAKARNEKPPGSAGFPEMTAWLAVFELMDEIDLASVKRFRESLQGGFRWFRVEAGEILMIVPLTPECAKRIATSAKAKDWLKDMRTYVNPIELQANDDGLTIVLGKQGQPILFTHADDRPIRAADENALIKHAGAVGPIVIDGKAMTADQLIGRFIADKAQGK